jgi:hypothetical protein
MKVEKQLNHCIFLVKWHWDTSFIYLMTTKCTFEHLETFNAVQTGVAQPMKLNSRLATTWGIKSKNIH